MGAGIFFVCLVKMSKPANSIENLELLKRKGLEPVDFLKYTLPLPGDTVDEILEMGLGLEDGMLPKEHPWRSLGPEILQQICLPDGSAIRSKIPQFTELYHRNEDCRVIPGLLEATVTLCEERAKGRKSYRNFTRRLHRSAQKRKRDLSRITVQPPEAFARTVESPTPEVTHREGEWSCGTPPPS